MDKDLIDLHTEHLSNVSRQYWETQPVAPAVSSVLTVLKPIICVVVWAEKKVENLL